MSSIFHNIAGSNVVAAITLLPAILKQHNIAASNVKAEQCYGIAPALSALDGWRQIVAMIRNNTFRNRAVLAAALLFVSQ